VRRRDPADDESIGGLGTYFIYEIMDQVEYTVCGEGTRLHLVKQVPISIH
jgi:anti-sigma regulatory factor (Ser/Thr protein kinase)